MGDENSTTTGAIWPPEADALVSIENSRPVRGAADEELDLIQRFVTWPSRHPGRAAEGSTLLIALTIAAVRLPSLVDGEWSNLRELLLYSAVVLVWMLLATGYVRTITPRQVVAFAIMGAFGAGPLVDAAGAILDDHISGNAMNALTVPVLEEVAKLLPVALFAGLMTRAGRGFGAMDLALLGAATGGGFAVFEDLLWGRAFASGFEGWGLLYPSSLQEPLVVAGHLVWSAMAGLGLGILVVHRRRPWAWVAGSALLLVPLLDHAAVNYRGDEFDTLRSWLLDGQLAFVVLTVALVVVLTIEAGIIQRSAQHDHLFVPVPIRRLLVSPLPALFGRSTSERQLHRFRNAVVYRRLMGGSPRPVHLVELLRIRSALITPTEPSPPTS